MDEERGGEFTHLDASGRARMVDVGGKASTDREAIARAELRMQADTLRRIQHGEVSKGDVLAVARVAAIMAVKKTAEWIPLCHPISITGVDVSFSYPEEDLLRADVAVRTVGPTGVEMEALTGASACALTVYDMCKAVDRGMYISFVGLMEKRGGKSGHYVRDFNESG